MVLSLVVVLLVDGNGCMHYLWYVSFFVDDGLYNFMYVVVVVSANNWCVNFG